jgi:hypothetical protein
MKGMNFNDKDYYKKDNEKNGPNVINNANFYPLKKQDSEKLNFNLKKENSKDIKDYIETQKMLIELEKLQSDEISENENVQECQFGNPDILNEFKELNDEEFDAEDLAVNTCQNLILV